MTFLHLESISLSSNYIVIRYIVGSRATRRPRASFLISMGPLHKSTALEIQHAARGCGAIGAGGPSGYAACRRPERARAQRAEGIVSRIDRRIPPKGAWDPPDELLRKLTAKHLALARNCGPRTTREIIAWAGARGVHIEPPPRTSKSLSAAWQELAANASSGKLTRAEITAALERSIRRRSARIPVAFQIILLKILSSTYE